MSQIITRDKQETGINRADFLERLYQAANPEFFFEIRCIHPQKSKPIVLWASIGNEHQMQENLQLANKLNQSGYGVYFAPCLRHEKKGRAESASLVPALWVDIDCGDEGREKALGKLATFTLKPSIIVDSGGGWHAYWLLNSPFLLENDEQRQHIAKILQGLFAAVGGDEEYAKSVASLMRLPDFTNTKPERGGVVASICEFHPEQSYSLSDFDWLIVENPKKPLSQPIFDGHAPLPQVTLDYLAHGASSGNRNRALFDAACQFRDAGYSQSEAETQLIPRYVADGSGNELANSRELEAKTTIESAYRQSPRDPIPTKPKAMVDELVNRYGKAQDSSQVSPEELAEAIKACAHLEALEWAEQRQRLKAFCGNGVRLTDLDRQYREARKAIEREEKREHHEAEEYYESDGRMVYRRETYHGPVEKTVASWFGQVVERVSRVNDDGDEEHITCLELRNAENKLKLQVPSEMFGDDAALRRFIAAKAGETYTVRAGMGKHLAPAILSLSGDYPQRRSYRFMGWTRLNEKWTYVAPCLAVNSKGIVSDAPEIELDTRLRDYRLCESNWEEALKAFSAIIPVFPKQLAPACIAFAMLPLVQNFFPAAAPRPAIHLAGTYGSGKSELAALMSSFYGNFSRDTPPAQWGDTINTVEALGYPLASALFWVDDYKAIYADERTFTRFLQSYSRGMGRGRLNRDAKVRQERPCRGLLLSTGETVIEGEASVLSRMLVLEVPPWEQRDPQGEALAQAEALRNHLPAFSAHFAIWIAKQAENGDFTKRLSESFSNSIKGYREKLKASGMAMSNTGRVIQNWAVLVSVYRLLNRFMREQDADEVLPVWEDVIVETAQAVRQERASEVFLNTLSQLLASGDVTLASDTKNPEEPRTGSTLVGYRDENYVYLLPEVTFKAVSRVQLLKFTVSAIGSQLREDGYLIPGSSSNHLTVQLRIRDNRVRLWRLKAAILSGDNGVSGDD